MKKVNYFSSVGSLIADNERHIREIKSRIVVAKAAFSNNNNNNNSPANWMKRGKCYI
jgi:hypothetical protein